AVLTSLAVEVHRRLQVGCVNRPSVRTPREVREDPCGTRCFVRSRSRPAHEDAVTAGRRADTSDVVRSFDAGSADLRHTANHVDFLAVTQRGFPDILPQRRTFTPREAYVVRPGRHLNASRHAGVQDGLRFGKGLGLLFVILRTPDRGGEHLLTVDRDDKRVRRVVALNADISLFYAAEQTGGQFVLSISRENVTHDGPAARAERQALDVGALAELSADRILPGGGKRFWITNNPWWDA